MSAFRTKLLETTIRSMVDALPLVESTLVFKGGGGFVGD